MAKPQLTHVPPNNDLILPGGLACSSRVWRGLRGERFGRLLGGAGLQDCKLPSPVTSASDEATLVPHPDLR